MDTHRWPYIIWNWDKSCNVEAWYDDICFILQYLGLDVQHECESLTDLKDARAKLLNQESELRRLEITKKPKLVTMEKIHDFDSHKTLLQVNLNRIQRSLVTKFKSRVLPLHVETGRFKGVK